MEDFDGDGVFWIPEREDWQVAGRLRFSNEDGVNLDLIGTLAPLADVPIASDDRVPRIVGIAGKKLLTLDHCLRKSSSFEMPGIQRESWTAAGMLAGAHWGTAEPLMFDEVAVEFNHLPVWIGRTGISSTFDRDDQRISKVTLVLEPLPEENVACGDGQLTLGFGWGKRGDEITGAQLDQTFYLKIQYPHPLSLSEILMDANGLGDLVTLAADSPAVLTSLSLWSSEVTAEVQPDRRETIEFRARQIAPTDVETQSRHRMLLGLADIGGLATVAAWVVMARRYRPVLGALLSVRYATRMYSENRYQNVISAAETLHRMDFPNAVRDADEFKLMRRKIIRSVPKEHRNWLGQQLQFSNEPRLYDRLTDLVAFAGEPFWRIVGDTARWVEVVVQARNRLTHHDESKPLTLEPGDHYHLGESIYVLVLFCLLRACGVPADALASAPSNGRMRFIAESLPPVVERLSAQIQLWTNDWEEE